MAPKRSKSDSSPPRFFRVGDQYTIASILAMLLIAISWHWWQTGKYGGQTVEIERAESWQVTFQVDVNEARWQELTLLPEIGEQLAKRIVDSRAANGPFVDHNDLQRVRGIGPKTMHRIRPYLLPIPDHENVATIAEDQPAG